MTDEIFNIFAAIGIGLTFIASLSAVIVSIVSMRSAKSNAEYVGYLNMITAFREKWQIAMRESASNYFAQVTRICAEQESDLSAILNELNKYHFEIVLLIFKQDKQLHDNMSAIRKKSSEIVEQHNIVTRRYEEIIKENPQIRIDTIEEIDGIIKSARKNISDLKSSIDEYKNLVFNEIRKLIEIEWNKQKKEVKGENPADVYREWHEN